MQLSELKEQYLIQSQKLLKRIHELNIEVNRLKGNDRIIMKRRILSLYSDAAECRRIATVLANYRKEVKNEQNNLQP